MRKLFFLTLISVVLIQSCKKDNVAPEVKGMTDVMARDSLYYIMNDWYYWVNEMPAVNKDSYSDPYTLLEAMRYKELDRWSFVADYNEFESEMAGSFVGHGFRIGLDDMAKARIVTIYSGSPLYASGVRRGWIVKKINGVDIAPLLQSGNTTAYKNAIGPAEAGVTNTFIFERPDGSEVTIPSTKSSFTVNTVLLYDTLHLSSGVAGHLVFESFIKPSTQELQTAFAFFKQNNVTDLILDLRYNSGGYLDIAETLSSYIGGNNLAGKIFGKLQFNDKRTSQNTSYPFVTTNYSLGLTRMVVITSRSTASASEAVINSLKPFMQIVTVGDTTNGKPTGMLGWDIGKKYWMWPVTFKIVNSQDQGDYFAGFSPNKVEMDDIKHDFDDRNELCLSQSINYLETGVFKSAKSSKVFKKYPQVSEKPSWMNNTFVRDK